jgi:hypothetical protein
MRSRSRRKGNLTFPIYCWNNTGLYLSPILRYVGYTLRTVPVQARWAAPAMQVDSSSWKQFVSFARARNQREAGF